MGKINAVKGRSAGAKPLRNEFGPMSREAQLELLFSMGHPNDKVWAVMENLYPEIIEDDKKRALLAGKKIPFDSVAREKLGRQLRSVKGIHKRDQEADDDLTSFAGKGMVIDLDDIKWDNVLRIPTGTVGWDHIFGETVFLDEKGETTGRKMIGMPRGATTILAGSEGVGKSRAAVALCGKLIHMLVPNDVVKDGVSKTIEAKGKVLYNYGESRPEQFKQWTKGIKSEGRFFVSTLVYLADIIAQIREKKPDLVVIDSLNMILEAKSHKGMIRVLAAMRSVARETNCHIIMIAHLNKAGEIKGSRDLPYLVDVTLYANPIEGRRGFFEVACPNKNRYGPTPVASLFQHMNGTVECISTDKDDAKIKHYTLVRPAVAEGQVDAQKAPAVAVAAVGVIEEDEEND